MCEFISQSYTYVSWRSPLSLSQRNLRTASLDRIEAYADEGNLIPSKRERSFLRTIFLICELISQTCNIDFRKQFANTLFVESGKLYLGAHRGPCWKRKYANIITTAKLSERLLSDVWLQHRVPPFPSWNSFLTLLSWILQRNIWELNAGYDEKENILT